MLPAVSLTRNSNSRFESNTAAYDVASNIYLALMLGMFLALQRCASVTLFGFARNLGYG